MDDLPTYYFRPSSEGKKHDTTVYLSEYGEAQPVYTVRYPDPALPASRNRYAVALYDSYNPEVLFAEVLLVPVWDQRKYTDEEIRLNGGVAPGPRPLQPAAFTVQLYNPDHQVQVQQKQGSWSAHWEFEIPQQSFRQPSISALDRTLNDPAASETTPKISFRWKKDGRLSKDLICAMSGKSSNPDGSKKKSKEPDITLALYRHQKELAIYEPNFCRVEIEDKKGLEVVILLTAVVLRDVYYGNIKEAFNFTEVPRRNSNNTPLSGRKLTPPAAIAGLYGAPNALPKPPKPARSRPESQPPPTDLRSQWEIDAETHRLRKIHEHEERQQQKAEEAETKRVKKMLEAEEREARRKQAQVEKETQRLKKIYGQEQTRLEATPHLPPRRDVPQRYSAPSTSLPYVHTSTGPQYHPSPQYQSSVYMPVTPSYPPPWSSGPYLQPPGPGMNGAPVMSGQGQNIREKRSLFGLRSRSDDAGEKIRKKKSSLF